jgi:hypothetical protein
MDNGMAEPVMDDAPRRVPDCGQRGHAARRLRSVLCVAILGVFGTTTAAIAAPPPNRDQAKRIYDRSWRR